MSKSILLHFWLCSLEVGLVLFPLGAEVLFRGYGHVSVQSFHFSQWRGLQFLLLFLVVIQLFGFVDQQEVFQEEVGGEFRDVGKGFQEFLEDYALLAEVSVVVAGVQGREDFTQPYEVAVPAAVDDIDPFEGSAVYIFVFGDFDFDVRVLKFVGLDSLELDVVDVDAVSEGGNDRGWELLNGVGGVDYAHGFLLVLFSYLMSMVTLTVFSGFS
jgi:hypothetical protein